MPTQEMISRRPFTRQNVGPGDATVAIVSQPGTSSLDYYSQNGNVQLEVYFEPQDPNSTGTVQVDFGPQQSLQPGAQPFSFNEALQITINNASGSTKYGWVVLQ